MQKRTSNNQMSQKMPFLNIDLKPHLSDEVTKNDSWFEKIRRSRHNHFSFE